jgi:RNA polymerase sigma-70 factor (ECF subfamily)
MRYGGAVHADDLDALVTRAQAGDVRAFEALVASQLPKVRRFARAFAGSEPEADDLAQEALLRVYRSLGTFRWQSAFSTWLFAVVRSAFLDAGKGRAATRRALEVPLAPEHGELEGGERPDEALGAAQARAQVWAALRRVPEEFRAALVLFDIEGCSYDEVAAVEGVAVGTVKSRLHRGRAHLRRILEEAGALERQRQAVGPLPGTAGAAVSSNVRKP